MRRIAAFMFPCAFVCAFLLGGSPPQTAPKVLAFAHVAVINANGRARPSGSHRGDHRKPQKSDSVGQLANSSVL